MKTKRTEEEKKNKKQSDLVTRESLSAVCALFSVCALFVICTGPLVFGDMGKAIQALLLGVFGYAAYPVCALGAYLGVTSLFGVRLVKRRKLFALCALAATLFALILHTAITYTWSEKGYLSACFNGGDSFASCTVTGWLGGLLVAGLVAITSKIGSIVIFSALFLLCGYAIYRSVKKVASEPTAKVSAETDAVTVEGQPVREAATAMPETPYAQRQSQPQPQLAYDRYGTFHPPYGYGMPTVSQRPGVRISDESGEVIAGEKNGYSPFSPTPTEGREATEYDGKNGREFLFGFTPAESYRKNLIFDATANVNKRPTATEQPKAAFEPAQNASYTPSYLESYENSVNEADSTAPLSASVTEKTYQPPTPVSQPTPSEEPYATPYVEPVKNEPIAPAFEPMFNRVEDREPETRFGGFESRGEDRGESLLSDREERSAQDESSVSEARRSERSEYSDYFSLSNPNIFGREEEIEPVSERETEIPSSREETSLFGDRNRLPEREEYFERGSEREENAFGIFDDREEREEETPLRDGRESFIEKERDAEATGRFGFGRDSRESFEESSVGREERVEKIEPKAEEPKPTPPPPPPKPRIVKPYVRVPLDYFDCRDVFPDANEIEVADTKDRIIDTLACFKVNDATISSVTFGPTVTRYNVVVPCNIPTRKVVSLDQDIAINLQAANGVNIYPNFEDGAVSIEVPNRKRQFVSLGCMLTGDAYVNAKPNTLMFAMGKDVGNRKVYGDICKMIHLLVAGASGMGKSVFLGSMILSLISKYSPSELRLILIDPKKTEFVLYNNLPHLMINEIITEVGKAVQSLNWAIGEMNRRYGLFEQMSRSGTYVVNIDEYNSHLEKAEDKLPKIVIIIDELADLMLSSKKDVEDRIQNLTQKARAAGIHLIVATQRPSADVITGVIKGNLPTRIAFGVASEVDSRVILDQSGAQKLLGKGDFLYTMSGINTPIRVQSAFSSSEESQNVINFIKMNNEAYFDESATSFINNTRGSDDSLDAGEEEVEDVYIEALRFVILSGSASISMIQRKCSVGYNKAGKIIEWMEEMGYISNFEGAKARKVLITKEEFESKYGAL